MPKLDEELSVIVRKTYIQTSPAYYIELKANKEEIILGIERTAKLIVALQKALSILSNRP